MRQRSLLQGLVGQRMKAQGLPADFVAVELAMRYGNPSVASALDRLAAAGCDRIVVVPMYPQYAASTTASALDAVYAWTRTARRMPALRAVDAFHDHPGYIRALAACVNDYWMKHGRPDKLLLSFHGVPRRSLDLGDPYHCHCHKTARLLAAELGLEQVAVRADVPVALRQGRVAAAVHRRDAGRLPGEGVRRVDVFCPGFVADCLETLEEIGIEGKAAFIAAGGREFHAIPCLNEHPAWIAALADVVQGELSGWLAPPPDAAAREATLQRAKALGATG